MALPYIDIHRKEVVFGTDNAPWGREDGTNFPVGGWRFVNDADKYVVFSFIAKDYAGGNLKLTLHMQAETATSGTVQFAAQLAAATPDTDTTAVTALTLGTAATATQAVGSPAGRTYVLEITLTSLQSLAADDVGYVVLMRDVSVPDDMAGFARVTEAGIEEV